MENIFLFVFIGIFIFTFGFIMFGFYSTLTKRGRSRWIGRQLETMHTVLDDNKDLIKDLSKLGSEIGVQTQKEFYENNADDLRYVSRTSADIEAEAIKRKAQAFKEGLGGLNMNNTSTSSRYCKYCGEAIDNDALYCDQCGRKQ